MKLWEKIRTTIQPEEERKVKELLSELETIITSANMGHNGEDDARKRVSQIIDTSVQLLRTLSEREHNAYDVRKRELLLYGYTLGQLIARANGERHMNVGIKSTDRDLVPWKLPA